MPVLAPEAVEFFTGVFNEADKDKSGSIDKAELKAAATKLAEYLEVTPPTDEQIDKRIEMLDTEGDGTVTLDEFLMFLAITKVLTICITMFTNADTDNTGTIGKDNLKVVMTNIYEAEGLPPPTDEKVTETMTNLDASGDGAIDFEEFCSFMIPLVVAMSNA